MDACSLQCLVEEHRGWLAFDLADYETSSHYYKEARQAAYESEDTDHSVFVLCNMSHLATWQGRVRVGVDHAVAAQNWANETGDGLLRAYPADVAARAYAGMNNWQACLAALDTAQVGVTDAGPQTPGTSLAYFYGLGQLASTRSLCLLQLGDVVGAEQAAHDSLRQMGSSFVRNQAFSTIHLGNAYLAMDELEQAAEAFGEGAALAARNRSARVVTTIWQARQRMRPWQDTPAVRAGRPTRRLLTFAICMILDSHDVQRRQNLREWCRRLSASGSGGVNDATGPTEFTAIPR